MVSWGALKPVILPISIIIVVTTILVMGVSGRIAQFILKERIRNMSKILQDSTFFCLAISLIGYEIGIILRQNETCAL